MTVTAVVGAQWGDEGKGRIIDALAEEAAWVVRFQGGDNAGHTVINHFGEFKLHLVPSGIFHSGTKCLIGTGCVVNPATLLKEIDNLKADSEKFEPKLKVLMENVEHHAEEEEEGKMFPKVEQICSGEELEELGQELEAAKSGRRRKAG